MIHSKVIGPMHEEFIIRILLAALVGGVIGLERVYHDKSAGFRTMILIATGSALFTIISVITEISQSEATRIAAAVVSGVGFLGAGVIIKDGMNIRGLTTAASIWLVAALGMGVGLGFYFLVGVTTIVILMVLWVLPPVERRIDALHEFVTLCITIKNSDAAEEKVVTLFADAGIRVVELSRVQLEAGTRVLEVTIKTTPTKRSLVTKALANSRTVKLFRVNH